jgi:hypothetical protein
MKTAVAIAIFVGTAAALGGAFASRAAADPNACKTNADCTTTSREATGSNACCSTCGDQAISKVAARKLEATCKTAKPARCPSLDCIFTSATSACVKGTCTTVSALSDLTAPPAPVPPPPPAYDASCKQAADCQITDLSLTGEYACCSSCTRSALSRTGTTKLAATCKANPPKSCPPLGCVQPFVHADCIKGTCAVVINASGGGAKP